MLYCLLPRGGRSIVRAELNAILSRELFVINQVFSKAGKQGEKCIFISGKNELTPRNLKSDLNKL